MKIYFLLITLTAFVSLHTNANIQWGDVRITQVSPNSENANWISVNDETPRYPLSLARKGGTGCGLFKLTVNPEGKAENIALIHSTIKRGVKKPSRKIIRSIDWQLSPDGLKTSEEKVLRIDYCLGGKDIKEAQALCAKQAQLECK